MGVLAKTTQYQKLSVPRAPVPVFLYHETLQRHLPGIVNEGVLPLSYGQSFVRDDGSVASPAEALEDILAELDEGADEGQAEEILHQEHLAGDFVPRTYVLLSEPMMFKYGDVLLRFPAGALKLKKDVDHYITSTVLPGQLEVRENGAWRRLSV